jgi:hypothetical protein
MWHLKLSTVPTPTSAGRLGRLFNIDTPIKSFKEFWEFCCQFQSLHSYPLCYFRSMDDNSKITLVDPRTYKAPLVKEKLPEEEDTDHCFVYDMAKSRGGRYSDGSCVELPFSWKLLAYRLAFSLLSIRVSERKRLPPFGSGENVGWNHQVVPVISLYFKLCLLNCTKPWITWGSLIDERYCMNLFIFRLFLSIMEKASLQCDAWAWNVL